MLHISGPSLFSARIVDVAMTAVHLVKANGGSISFDPNVRKEMLGAPGLPRLCAVLERCDTFLPSGEELMLLTEAGTPQGAIDEILSLGASTIVLKDGRNGATYYSIEGHTFSAGYQVDEVDPTGAGDCFDATFLTCRLQGRSVEESLGYANASGAQAVAHRGPMEGTAGLLELDTFRSALPKHQSRGSGRRGATRRRLDELVGQHSKDAVPRPGITSVCVAHPLVIEAAFAQASDDGTAVLIESTCNQVNQHGGYTGMSPAEFRDEVYRIADSVSFDRDGVILGGDHLGPNPWRHLSATQAMAEAEVLVAGYVAAGFEKIHIDTSMGCAGEPDHLPGPVTARAPAVWRRWPRWRPRTSAPAHVM